MVCDLSITNNIQGLRSFQNRGSQKCLQKNLDVKLKFEMQKWKISTLSFYFYYYLALSKFWVGKKICDNHTASNRHKCMATYTLLPARAQPLGCLDSLLDYHAYVLVWPHFSRTIWHILPCNPWDTKPIISTKLSLENTCKKLFKIGHHLKIEVLKKISKWYFAIKQKKKEKGSFLTKRIDFESQNFSILIICPVRATRIVL